MLLEIDQVLEKTTNETDKVLFISNVLSPWLEAGISREPGPGTSACLSCFSPGIMVLCSSLCSTPSQIFVADMVAANSCF